MPTRYPGRVFAPALPGMLGGSDPLLRSRYPNAVPDAECRGGGPSGPVELSAGGAAVRLDIGPVTCIDDVTASVPGGGPHSGGTTASERVYTVAKDGDGWRVTGEKQGLTI